MGGAWGHDPAGVLLVLVERVWLRRLDFPLKLSYVLTGVLEVRLLPLQVLGECLSRGDERVAAEVRSEPPLNVVLLVAVGAVARTLRFFAGLAPTPTVPVEVGPQGRSRQEHLDGRVVVAPQRLVRVVDLLVKILINLPSV